MLGLTILVAAADPVRFHAALSLAAAQAALGGRARLYLHGEAVSLLGSAAEDAGYAVAGLPDLAELLTEAAALGVKMIACQSGLELAGLNHADIEPDVEAGGLIGLLAELGEDRLVVL